MFVQYAAEGFWKFWWKPAHLSSNKVVVGTAAPGDACENIGQLTNGNLGKLHQIIRLQSLSLNWVQKREKPS